MMKLLKFFLVLLCCSRPLSAERLMVPMDLTQKDHLKAYGLAFWSLERGINVEWLLNYRGGSFLLEFREPIAAEAHIRGVSIVPVSASQAADIYAEIDASNMEVVLLEKAPRIAIYTPPNSQPWDDAVTMALEYAQIKYHKVWDPDVLQGTLDEYDWLHLHHEDFTGQYGKFYQGEGHKPWYREQQRLYEAQARHLGFGKVSEEKKAVAPGHLRLRQERWIPLCHVLGDRYHRYRPGRRGGRHRPPDLRRGPPPIPLPSTISTSAGPSPSRTSLW